MAIIRALSAGWISLGAFSARCVLGKGGVRPAAEKREGDGATPLGRWPMRRVLFRPDRLAPPATALPVLPISHQDGWCDAAEHPLYNLPVSHPFEASAERLWRDDGLYDLIVVLGHNDDPVVPGAGSAIFLHCAAPDWRATQGCVAMERADLQRLLTLVAPGDDLEIVEGAA